MRPYLHEFLAASYEFYDIIIWSATSMSAKLSFVLSKVQIANLPLQEVDRVENVGTKRNNKPKLQNYSLYEASGLVSNLCVCLCLTCLS